jgi:hypothetical protein
MSLTNYENGVTIVKRLRTTVLKQYKHAIQIESIHILNSKLLSYSLFEPSYFEYR